MRMPVGPDPIAGPAPTVRVARNYGDSPARRPTTPPPPPGPGIAPRRPLVLGSRKKGGKINKTGLYKLHKGEDVIPLSSLHRIK